MIARTLISETFQPLHELMTEKEARAIMNNYRIFHLPVIDSENNLMGILCEEDIPLSPSGNKILKDIQNKFLQEKVSAQQHIFEIIENIFKQNLTCIPVVEDSHKYIGLITSTNILNHFAQISSLNTSGAIIVFELNNKDYSLSKISQIIEENNAKIISLYTNFIIDSTKLEVTIKLNTHDISEIVESFNRFDYTIKTYFEGFNKLHELYKDRIDNLKNYLEI